MVTRFKERLNQYKLNVNLYIEGDRGLIQEKMIFSFSDFGHNGLIYDMYVKITDHHDPNNFGIKNSKKCIHMN